METAKERLLVAIPYFRNAVNSAKANAGAGGKVQMGILAVKPDGSGKIEMQFDCEEFFKDIEEVLGSPEHTIEKDMEVEAFKFMNQHGIKSSTGDLPDDYEVN